MFCTNCGSQNEEGVKFCVNCGSSLEETAEQAVVPAEELGVQEVNNETGITEFTDTMANQKKSFLDMLKNPKNIIIAVAALVVIVVLVIVGINLLGSDEIDYSKYPVVYRADGKVKVRPNGAEESYKLGSNVDFEYIRFSEGADYIYFIENGKLYYRDAEDLEAKDEKIASDVVGYTILGDTKNVLYRTEDGDIYFHDLEEKYKVAKNVSSYTIDEDYKNIRYLTDEGKLYIRGLGEKDEATKIDTKVDYTIYTEPNFDNTYYVKEDAVYLYDGKDSKKLGKDFNSTDYVGGTLYAFKEVTDTYRFDELVIDDLSDSLGVEPYLHLKRPRQEDYSSYSEYDDAYDYWYEYYDLDDDIRDAFYIYEDIQDAKKDLNENPIEVTTYDLYAYLDGEFKKIDSGLTSSYLNELYAEEDENSLAYYRNSKSGSVNKVNLSEFEDSLYMLRYELSDEFSGDYSDGEVVLLKDGKVIEGLENAEEIDAMDMSLDGKALYTLVIEDDDESGDVVKYKIGSDKLTGAEVVLQDAVTFSVYDNDAVFGRNDDEEVVGLVNGDEINLGEDIYSYRYVDGEIYYITDYNDEKDSGELVRYNGGDEVTICDDVYYSYAIFGEDKIVYIQDYDGSEGGELCISDSDGNAEVVDDEVTNFMTYYY